MTEPQADPGLWDRIEAKLDDSHDPAAAPIALPPLAGRQMLWRRVAIVATLLLAVGLGVVALLQDPHEHDELAVDFDDYLETYGADPQRASEALFAEYPAEEVDAETATLHVGYRPVVANSLPAGYSVDSMHLMKMPCCTCVKTLCRSDTGRTFVVFEHDAKQAVWFGDRPKQQRDCGGVPTTVIEFDSQIAATWRVGMRSVTLIGARDINEVTKLMPFLGHDQSTG